jgi:hypothetical protein
MVVHDAELGDARAGGPGGRDDRAAGRPRADLAARGRRPSRATRRGRSSSPAAPPGAPAAPPAAARRSRTRSPRCPRSRCAAARRRCWPRPAFHAWGLGHLSLAMLLGSTVVLQRRFDPHRVLAAVEEHRATALVVVPGDAGEAARRAEGEGVRRLVAAGHRLQRQRAARATWSSGCRPASGRCSTTSTARPRWRTPPWPGPRTSPRPAHGRAAAARRHAARRRRAGQGRARRHPRAHLRRQRACPSAATPTAPTRTGSTGWSPPATSACCTRAAG